MQQRPWQRVLTQVGGAFVLFAVPAVALAWFSPSALSALAVDTAQTQTASLPLATVPSASEAADNVLEQWTDTQGNPITITLVGQARRESAALNIAVRQLRAQLAKATPGSFTAQLLQQSLALTAAERDSWDSTWRQIGVPGANQTMVQNTLISLQSLYIQGNSQLITLQAQEIESGSIFTYTPPTF